VQGQISESRCIKKKSNILGKKTAKTAQKQGKKEVISTGCYYTLTNWTYLLWQ
jgi:hypothetical protein